MKPKTKAFADELIKDPKISQTEAYIRTHITTNRDSARNSASELMAKPSVQIYLKKHVQMAKRTMVSLAGDDRVKSGDRIKAAQDILDRTLGKAVQRTESENKNVNMNIEASTELNEAFTDFLKQSTRPT